MIIKQYWMKILLLAIIIGIFQIPLREVTIFAQNVINNISLEIITGKCYPPHFYNYLLKNIHGTHTPNGVIYQSEIPGLKAILDLETKNNHESTVITIVWGKMVKELTFDGPVSYIRWRPKHCGFMYSLFDEGSGGDFGTSSLHYVEISISDGQILVNDREVTSHEIDTDMGWSNSGKYFAYAVASSLRIRNFETGRIWATKLIKLTNGEKEINIEENRPSSLGGFYWDESDKKLFFSWKEYIWDDGQTGWAEVDLEQFNLD